MRRSKPLELGTWNAVCDRCGWYFKAYELRKEWTGLMTCHGSGTNDCWEPKHPQLSIQAIPDSQVVPYPRPEPVVDDELSPDGIDYPIPASSFNSETL